MATETNNIELPPECAQGACPNCGNSLKSIYCHNCGQHKIEHDDLTFKRFLRLAFEQLFEVDSKLMSTLKSLFFRPGELTRDYILGKRASHVSPIRLFLIFSAIYFLGSAKVFYSITFEDTGSDFYDIQAALRFLLAVPLFAFVLMVLWFDKRYRAGSHFIFALHYFSFDFAIFTILSIPLYLIPENQQLNWVGPIISLGILSLFIYVFRMFMVVFDARLLRAFLMSLVVITLDIQITFLVQFLSLRL